MRVCAVDVSAMHVNSRLYGDREAAATVGARMRDALSGSRVPSA